MTISNRVKEIEESITLKLNARAVALAAEGKQIYNLTAGQLPFKPPLEFTEIVKTELNFLKSYQYSPVAGFPELRKKFIDYVEKSRGIDFKKCNSKFDCVIGNGGKHVIYNIINSLVDPHDEVIILTPYWVSYPEMVKIVGGTPIVVGASLYDAFIPSLDDLKKCLSEKTKLVIINSPNNPGGIHYSKEWMAEFSEIISKYPDVYIMNDEIYYELSYFDPKPTFHYHVKPELLERTIIVDGISKSFASTGLRLGYCIAPEAIATAISKFQGQTTSGASSLIQRAIYEFDFNKIEDFLIPVKTHLRTNSKILKDILRQNDLSHLWYQAMSAFYFVLDMSKAPVMQKYKSSPDDNGDYSDQICEDLLNQYGIATVPGTSFGLKNAARISLVLDKEPFTESINILVKFLLN
jgi:aspartate aminotransferase